MSVPHKLVLPQGHHLCSHHYLPDCCIATPPGKRVPRPLSNVKKHKDQILYTQFSPYSSPRESLAVVAQLEQINNSRTLPWVPRGAWPLAHSPTGPQTLAVSPKQAFHYGLSALCRIATIMYLHFKKNKGHVNKALASGDRI